MATTSPSPDPLTTVTAALALCVAPQLALEGATRDLREQAARAGDAARTVPIGRDGVRALRRQLVTLERMLEELEEARTQVDAQAGRARAALDLVFATDPDPRRWLMHRQAQAIDEMSRGGQ